MTQAALILAAGPGSRLRAGLPKPLLPFRGRPLVLWQVEAALAAGVGEVVVVDGAADLSKTLPPEVSCLHNRGWREGQAGSLRLGVDWCRRRGHQAVVVGLADQPLVPAEAWERVATAPSSPIVMASYGGRRGHPVRLRRDIWPLLPATGDQGARTLIARHPDWVLGVECPGEPMDLDTPADLRALGEPGRGAGDAQRITRA